MTGPTFIELRRSNALTVGLIVGAVAALWFGGQRDLWPYQWNWYANMAMSVMFVLVPLALAGGAMLGRRDGHTRADELIASTGRPRWQQVTPGIAALTIATIIAYLLVLVAGVVVVAVSGSYLGGAGLLPMLVGITVLAGALWVGIGAGRAWPSPMVPPALAVIGLVVQLAGDTITPLQALSMAIQPPGADWETPSLPAVLGRLALGLGLLAGGYLLTAGASRLTRAGGLATVAAGVAVTMAVTPTSTAVQAGNRIDTAAQRLVCTDDGPQVCVTAVHAYLLESVAPPARAALTKLAKLPDAPTRAVEWRADTVGTGDDADYLGDTPKTEPGTVSFRLDLARGEQETDTDIEASILNGAGTTANGCRLDDPGALWAAGAWLAGGDTFDVKDFVFGLKLSPEDYQPVLTKLRQAPEKEQLRRVTEMRDAANACRTSNLTAILTGESAS